MTDHIDRTDDIQPYVDQVWQVTKARVDQKLKKALPYNFFLSPPYNDQDAYKDPLVLSFQELLDKSIGDLTESLHLTNKVEIGWLFSQYFITNQRNKKITLIYEMCDENLDYLKELNKIPNLYYHQMIYPFGNGNHNSKLSMFAYADNSIRIIIMTANLCAVDWMSFTQGIWVSPRIPLKRSNNQTDGDSATNFKKDLLRYLRSYNLELLSRWINKIENADFSEINVFFIANIPDQNCNSMCGHEYLQSILKKYAHVPSNWPLILQSSVGNIGQKNSEWLMREFIPSLTTSTSVVMETNPFIEFFMIYPTIENIVSNMELEESILSEVHYNGISDDQLWLKPIMRKWISNSRKQSNFIPNLNTYCRISPDNRHMSWFLMTSAIISFNSFGSKQFKTRLPRYEVGVLFLPEFMINREVFPLTSRYKNNRLLFPLPYDLPLLPYKANEKLWLTSKGKSTLLTYIQKSISGLT